MTSVISIKDRSPRWARDAAIVATRGYGRATSRARIVPDFLVIGTKRGGTTSLFNYLMMHPGFLGLFPRPRLQKSTDYFFKGYDRGEQWYRSNFHTQAFRDRMTARLGYEPKSGEASPYYVWDPRIAQRAYDVNPDLKAVMLVRNPVERAFSHWQERTHNGVEPLTFEQALEAEDSRTRGELERMLEDPLYYSEAHDWYTYRSRGTYLPQLQNWTSVFPPEQLLVICSEDMYADVQGTVDRVSAFLGLPAYQLPTTKTFNASKRLPMPEAAREELTAFYAPQIRELSEHLGRPLSW
ncbi:MAG: sulfotransferase [Nocardioides sp.]